MKITGHQVSRNAVAFTFDDGHTLTVTGGRQNVHYTFLEFLREVSLRKKDMPLGSYSPERTNTKFQLADSCSKDSFLSYWRAASAYFGRNIDTMQNPQVINEVDLGFLHRQCISYVDSAQDGRRTKVGPLNP